MENGRWFRDLHEKGNLMAKQVKLGKGKEFTFKPAVRGGGGASKYPWAQWLNGDLLLLEQSVGTKDDKGNVLEDADDFEGRDYSIDTNLMPARLKAAARKLYKVVQISRVDADGKKLVDALIIKARPMTEAEKIAEDKQRIIDKQKLKEGNKKRREAKKAEANGTTEQAAAPAVAGSTSAVA